MSFRLQLQRLVPQPGSTYVEFKLWTWLKTENLEQEFRVGVGTIHHGRILKKSLNLLGRHREGRREGVELLKDLHRLLKKPPPS